MKELIVYGISGLASLFILGYSIHIMVGGVIDGQTEVIAIIIGELVAIGAMGWMVRDIRRQRNRTGE